MQKIKLIKIKDLRNRSTCIKEKETMTGFFQSYPTVGRPFRIRLSWSTTPVTKVLSHNTFETKNSRYKWQIY
jgi:hypothetical protein